MVCQWDVDGAVCYTSAAYLGRICIDCIGHFDYHSRLRHLEILEDCE